MINKLRYLDIFDNIFNAETHACQAWSIVLGVGIAMPIKKHRNLMAKQGAQNETVQQNGLWLHKGPRKPIPPQGECYKASVGVTSGGEVSARGEAERSCGISSKNWLQKSSQAA